MDSGLTIAMERGSSTAIPSREYTDVRASIQAAGETALLSYMDKYWKDYQGNDESLWKHEWDKHGTCIHTLNTECYSRYSSKEEMIDFFHITVDLFKTFDSYKVIKPKS